MDEIKPSISKLARLFAIVVIVMSILTTLIPRVNAEEEIELNQDLITPGYQSELLDKYNILNNTASTNIGIVEQKIILLYQVINDLNEKIEISKQNVNNCEVQINTNQRRLETQHEKNSNRILSMASHLVNSCDPTTPTSNSLINSLQVVEQIADNDTETIEIIDQMQQSLSMANKELQTLQNALCRINTELIELRYDLYDLLLQQAKDNEIYASYLVSYSQKLMNEGTDITTQAPKIVANLQNITYQIHEDNSIWLTPCEYKKISSPFGYRIHPVYKVWKMHNGVDLTNKSRTPIYATKSGIVIDSSWDDSSGYHVVIDHLDGYKSCYFHLRNASELKVGDVVTIGDYIGPMGTTGVSTGTHLHFGISYNGEWVDPMNYIYNE